MNPLPATTARAVAFALLSALLAGAAAAQGVAADRAPCERSYKPERGQ
jgi:hypothetical protein